MKVLFKNLTHLIEKIAYEVTLSSCILLIADPCSIQMELTIRVALVITIL